MWRCFCHKLEKVWCVQRSWMSYDVRFCWYIGQLEVGTALLVGGGSEKSFDVDLMFCCESFDVVDGVLQIEERDGLFIICIMSDDSEELGAVVFCKLGSQMLSPSIFPNVPDLPSTRI